MPKVTLISYTPDPEKVVAAAAKLCYSRVSLEALLDGLTQEKAADYLGMLSEMGHESPLEHASFTFGIEGIFSPDNPPPFGFLQRTKPALCAKRCF